VESARPLPFLSDPDSAILCEGEVCEREGGEDVPPSALQESVVSSGRRRVMKLSHSRLAASIGELSSPKPSVTPSPNPADSLGSSCSASSLMATSPNPPDCLATLKSDPALPMEALELLRARDPEGSREVDDGTCSEPGESKEGML
jgi:hypothetical protein